MTSNLLTELVVRASDADREQAAELLRTARFGGFM
jgi:hypothetical protein